MSEHPIVCRNVQKRYKEKLALDGTDLVVPRGSVFGLLGLNGAGKTTLLKSLMGLVRIQGGEIRVLGKNPDELDGATKARIGYVPQEVNLYHWMRVQQIVDYTASFYPRWNEAFVVRLLDEWQLDPRDKVGNLSGGQAQKLAIILALGHEPELLILDEPAASLDPMARREFLKTLLAMIDSGERTVLFSTHITSDLERVADHVGILKAGKTVYAGELGDLKDTFKRLRVTARQPLPASLNGIPGIIRYEVDGQRALLTVRGSTEAMRRDLESRFGADITQEDLNLEEIFLEIHRARP